MVVVGQLDCHSASDHRSYPMFNLSYGSVCEVQAKAVSYIVAGKDVFISLYLYQEIFLFLKAYYQCLTVLLDTNQATRQA